jgi:hypothetical protein
MSLQANFAVDFAFTWYDLWVGVFIDRPNRRAYVAPLPCCVFRVSW